MSETLRVEFAFIWTVNRLHTALFSERVCPLYTPLRVMGCVEKSIFFFFLFFVCVFTGGCTTIFFFFLAKFVGNSLECIRLLVSKKTARIKLCATRRFKQRIGFRAFVFYLYTSVSFERDERAKNTDNRVRDFGNK